MTATAETFDTLRNEAWRADHSDAVYCRFTDDLILIARVTDAWGKNRAAFSQAVAGATEPTEFRRLIGVLRMAERAIAAITDRAMKSVSHGYTVAGLDRLLASLFEARVLLVMPTARRMADGDPDRRTPAEIAEQIVLRVRFEEGRPVITEDVAAAFADPYGSPSRWAV